MASDGQARRDVLENVRSAGTLGIVFEWPVCGIDLYAEVNIKRLRKKNRRGRLRTRQTVCVDAGAESMLVTI